MQVRLMVRQFFVYQFGDGREASACFDNLSNLGPISCLVLMEDIYDANIMRAKVRDICGMGFIQWPNGWQDKYPFLNSLVYPNFTNGKDMLGWKGSDDRIHKCTVSQVWESIRPHAPKVPWFNLVWFPKHAFVMWLLMGERLKTQDRLKPWELRANLELKCSLCHEYMLIDVANRNTVRIVMAKLCFTALVYSIWNERNRRIFKGAFSSVDQLFEFIRSNVRLKLMSLRFKNSSRVVRMKEEWQIG
ncbi:uncharacterized protein [Rutidosis leptorrhynchoides]|uniref:uncharacterized protein n=1 Tax=Rutidosis leptorrhynchoides TaxID=125765 RepID=UPI003A98E3DA